MNMKLHSKFLLSLLVLVGSTTAAFAGPGPDYWLRMQQAAKQRAEATKATPAEPQAASTQSQAAKPELPATLTCARMLVPSTGGSKVPYTSVRCTPEMLKNDWRCQQACANAAKVKKG